MGGGAIKF